MPRSWRLELTVDAYGLDSARVLVRPGGGPRGHLAVRTGPVLLHCLDATGITTTAAAWARAHASGARLLPTRPTTTPDAVGPGGVAAPAAEVAIDGPQRWDVTAPSPGHPYVVVASDWLVVRVHDLPALESCTRAWATACALGARLLPNPPVPFAQLLRAERDLDAARQFLIPEHQTTRGRSR
jgi:hypothetical protein